MFIVMVIWIVIFFLSEILFPEVVTANEAGFIPIL